MAGTTKLEWVSMAHAARRWISGKPTRSPRLSPLILVLSMHKRDARVINALLLVIATRQDVTLALAVSDLKSSLVL